VFNRDEADELVSSAPEKQPGVPCMLVYTADDKLKVLEGKEIAALQKAHEGKFKPRTVAVKWLETVTDKRIFAFTNYGNCHKLDIYAPNLQCKLSEEGVSLKDLSKDAEKDEKIVAMFEVDERLPYGQLLFYTKTGMVKKTDWAEYEQRKDSFVAVKLNDGDEVISVEEFSEEEGTIIFVTQSGIGLNAKKDDIPTQGRIATGVHGISLREGDSVVYAAQITDEGEIVVATDEGKFKRVLAASLDPMARNRKGSMIVGMKEGANVICASYVTDPYALAVALKNGSVVEISTENAAITIASARARKVLGIDEDSVKSVYPLVYKKVAPED
jgi:DNA gyrase/topoisomerase IV subunit A